MVLGKDDNNYTKSIVFDFYAQEDIDKIIAFFALPQNFNLFTAEQMEYIYIRFLVYIKTSIMAQVQYCGSKPEDLIPLYDNSVEIITKGIKDKGVNNYFDQIYFDWKAINSFKVEGYQPFKVTNYGI